MKSHRGRRRRWVVEAEVDQDTSSSTRRQSLTVLRASWVNNLQTSTTGGVAACCVAAARRSHLPVHCEPRRGRAHGAVDDAPMRTGLPCSCSKANKRIQTTSKLHKRTPVRRPSVAVRIRPRSFTRAAVSRGRIGVSSAGGKSGTCGGLQHAGRAAEVPERRRGACQRAREACVTVLAVIHRHIISATSFCWISLSPLLGLNTDVEECSSTKFCTFVTHHAPVHDSSKLGRRL